MFDGVPEQFHQFITPRNSSSLPLHLPFPLHASATPTSTPNNTTFPTFDPYSPHHHHHHHHQLPLQPNQLLQQSLHHKDIIEEKEENSTSFEIERDQQLLPLQLNNIDPWTNDEVLALLRIRSSMESWFPEFTWEHVSRKLAEVGYKRSADKCKEKFEEETRYFTNITDNNTNNNNHYVKNNNYRFISELEELYQAGTEKTRSEGQQDKNMDHAITEDDSRNDVVSVTKKNDDVVVVVVEEKTNKERKRKRGENRFEVFKGFCESVVQKMVAQQEEMHNKLLQDMLKRDEEKFNREEAWKKQEMEKMNKELEIMAREQAIACDRHANIIQFLKNFSTFEGPNRKKVNPNSSAAEIIDNNSLQSKPSSVVPIAENQNPSSSLAHKDTLQVLPSSTSAPVLPNPSSSLNSQNDNSVLEANSISNNRDDIGRRWPKDEVLALINLRCTSLNNNNEEKEGNNKVPLWERISQGMLELGYKRSAKRCKEKWENINKYFRKTKDANRKRSIDSRTCPYFHLLSNLYKQGKLVAQQSEKPEGELNAPAAENIDQQTQAETASQVGPATGFTVQQVHHGGEKTLMQQQVPSLDFHDQF